MRTGGSPSKGRHPQITRHEESSPRPHVHRAASDGVGLADGLVGAAAGQPPGHLAGSGLGELPAGCLLRAMMSSA